MMRSAACALAFSALFSVARAEKQRTAASAHKATTALRKSNSNSRDIHVDVAVAVGGKADSSDVVDFPNRHIDNQYKIVSASKTHDNIVPNGRCPEGNPNQFWPCFPKCNQPCPEYVARYNCEQYCMAQVPEDNKYNPTDNPC